MMRQPTFIYNNWSAYDELSDNVALTEELAMRLLDEVLRLRRGGVILDGYLMDAFWFAEDGGYRTWKKPNWPDGPDRWLARCIENGIKPGLWLSTNALCHLAPIPEWEDSLNSRRSAMCLFDGGYLPHLEETLQYWYDRGVRIFKFDFADFSAATPRMARTHMPVEIGEMNVAALRAMLKRFRQRNPDVMTLGYNGFGGDYANTSVPFRKTVDEHWLQVFDSLYCGDPRPSDVPCMDFWRSMNVYSDHMVRYYEFNGIPLERIDNCEFMIGATGTCYRRGARAWKGLLVMSLARGGWVNTYHGNLDQLSEDEARWFAKAQSLFLEMQALGRISTFGGVPGDAEPYGYMGANISGTVYTVVNPSQAAQFVRLPSPGRQGMAASDHRAEQGRILFRDNGFAPDLRQGGVMLGPEQMAVVGFGRYADRQFDLGVQEDVVIPQDIQLLTNSFRPNGRNAISVTVGALASGSLRIWMRQLDGDGYALRVSGGMSADGTPLDRILRITATQHGKTLPVWVNYGKAIWSRLSWAVGEIRSTDVMQDEPVTITLSSTVDDEVRLEGQVFRVRY